jgi:type VI secretion system secreted protein VgrG
MSNGSPKPVLLKATVSTTVTTTGAAKCPAPAGKKGAPPDVKTGLGKDVDALVNKSPTLKKEIKKIQARKGKIAKGTAGMGTYTDPATRNITIDSNYTDPKDITKNAAHEVGHSLNPDKAPDASKLTKAQYVDAKLRGEGRAVYNNLKARDEIRAAGGPDIGVITSDPANVAKYEKVYNDPKLSEAQKLKQLGEVFRNNEHPSTDPGKTYGQYYGDDYDNLTKSTATAKGKGAGAKATGS